MNRPQGLWRSRWAAVGAATAVTLGAGGLGIANATITSGSKPVYVPVTPCRLLDTRPGTNVGPRNTPIGPNSEYEVTVFGSNGNCTIPATASGIMMNTTVVNGSASSFLTVFPADATRPQASSMNWVANQPPTPNEIAVKLSTDGKFKLYNLSGTVDVIGDVVGYFEDHDHSVLGQITMPAQALNESSAVSVITRADLGLLWQNSGAEPAFVSIHRPADFAGTGGVTLTLLVTRDSTAAGNVQFFARPRDYDDGDPFLDASGILSNITTNADLTRREIVMTIPANQLPKEWWEIVIQRNGTVAGAFTGDVVVSHVELTYERA